MPTATWRWVWSLVITIGLLSGCTRSVAEEEKVQLTGAHLLADVVMYVWQGDHGVIEVSYQVNVTSEGTATCLRFDTFVEWPNVFTGELIRHKTASGIFPLELGETMQGLGRARFRNPLPNFVSAADQFETTQIRLTCTRPAGATQTTLLPYVILSPPPSDAPDLFND